MGAWLRRLGWPEQVRSDVILAVSEAVSNAAEHAYPPDDPGEIDVAAALTAGPSKAQRIIAIVVDHGRWRVPSTDGRFRGRGLQVMRAVMDRFRLDPTPRGTRITLVSPAVRL